MEESYFTHKHKIKNKIKENSQRIKLYERVTEKLESSPNHENLVQNIKFLKRYVNEIKKETKEYIDIICHG